MFIYTGTGNHFQRLAIVLRASSNFSIANDTSASVIINGGTNRTTLGPEHNRDSYDSYAMRKNRAGNEKYHYLREQQELHFQEEDWPLLMT